MWVSGWWWDGCASSHLTSSAKRLCKENNNAAITTAICEYEILDLNLCHHQQDLIFFLSHIWLFVFSHRQHNWTFLCVSPQSGFFLYTHVLKYVWLIICLHTHAYYNIQIWHININVWFCVNSSFHFFYLFYQKPK